MLMQRKNFMLSISFNPYALLIAYFGYQFLSSVIFFILELLSP